MESIEQTLNGTANFGARVSATISRNGDLVSRLWYEMSPKGVLSTAVSHAPLPMQSLLKTVELEIGGQKIDKHYNHWLNTWSELTEDMNPAVKVTGVQDTGGFLRVSDTAIAGNAEIIKAPTPYQLMTYGVQTGGYDTGGSDPGGCKTLEGYAIVPLQFWFCRNVGLALPLIALQYHEVKVITEFEVHTAAGLDMKDPNGSVTTTGKLDSVKLWADYIYLDTDERRRFAQVSHEYLIEQLQYQSEGKGQSFKLNFNHPVKELIWCGQRPRSGDIGTIHDDSGNNLHEQDVGNTHTTMTLKLNGHERFAPRHQCYFTRCQPWTYHSTPHGGYKGDAISVYSFALKPEEHQPSGTCNFSRIDNAQLQFSAVVKGSSDLGLHIYAVNYNVLRIMSGMGGLAYSN